jgi:DNA mismatch endonuclease (patch repair protein)
MVDVHPEATRSRNMAAIRGKNTRPEMLVRKSLHAAGYRFRLHNRKLPGSPDIVLRKHKAVIFVNGCFFHGHKCSYFRWPATRVDFWRAKIAGNRERDTRNLAQLRAKNWRVLIIWECALRGNRLKRAHALARTTAWLRSRSQQAEIAES